jgi:Zn finger protein HypA/HybF involved in hydrogenase expression
MKIKIKELNCKRCGWIWFPRKPDVMVCPHCHSPLWDVAKVINPKTCRNVNIKVNQEQINNIKGL